MPGAGANPEAVAAEPRRDDEAWNRLNFTDCRNPIRRTVDVAGPDVRDGDAPELRQQFASSLMRQPNLAHIGAWIEYPVQLHRGHRVECPFRPGFMTLPHALEGPRGKTSPTAGKHGQEFAGESELLRRRIDSRAAADCQCVSAVATSRERDERSDQGIRQAGCARSHGENGRAHGRLREANSKLVTKRRS